MNKDYNAFKFRTDEKYKSSLSEKEVKVMELLIEFGSFIDPYGYECDCYNDAVNKILDL
jgi:hypothetical protein